MRHYSFDKKNIHQKFISCPAFCRTSYSFNRSQFQLPHKIQENLLMEWRSAWSRNHGYSTSDSTWASSISNSPIKYHVHYIKQRLSKMLFGDIQRSACNRLFNWWSNIQIRKHQKRYRLNTTFTLQLASGCCHRSNYPHACNISWTYPKLEEQYNIKTLNFILVFMFGFQSLLGCIIGC